MSPDDARHGAPGRGGYNQHLRDGEEPCRPCRDAAARYERGRQLDLLNGTPRLVSATGPRRKVRALVALGHTFSEVGRATGMRRENVRKFAHADSEHITSRVAARIAAAYDALSMRLPAEATSYDRNRTRYARELAKEHGWAVPLAWEGVDMDDPSARPYSSYEHRGPGHDDVDPVLVERILAGDLSIAHDATKAERQLVVADWTARTGRPLRDLARATGWKPERYTARPSTTNTKENAA